MTVNLLQERSDIARFVRVLEEVSPDVVVTQELAPEAADVLADAYPNHHLVPSSDFTGRGVATRLDAVFDDIPMPGRMGTSATLKIGRHQIRLAGAHLLNPVLFPWWSQVAGRRRQVEALLEWVDRGTGPVVVAGDFNATPTWPAYRRITSRLTDLIVEHKRALDSRPERTWGWRPGWPRMLRIDHVFGSGVTVFDCLVTPLAGSDHFAVVVDLAVGATGP